MLFRYYFGSDKLFDETVLNDVKRNMHNEPCDFYHAACDANGFWIETGIETILVSF
jgi:hypothetical protein